MRPHEAAELVLNLLSLLAATDDYSILKMRQTVPAPRARRKKMSSLLTICHNPATPLVDLAQRCSKAGRHISPASEELGIRRLQLDQRVRCPTTEPVLHQTEVHPVLGTQAKFRY